MALTRKVSHPVSVQCQQRFRDRAHAGECLAERLRHHAGDPSVLVLGLTRGGVPVASEVADQLGADLDFMVVRKLGVPGHEEYAMGAVATGGVRILNEEVINSLGIPDVTVARAAVREEAELRQREENYRGGTDAISPTGRTVILIDDGLATGATMKAAILALRSKRPKAIVLAVPVAPEDARKDFEGMVDEFAVVFTRNPLFSVGQWYDDFDQVSDHEVRQLLRQNRSHALRGSA